mmetsp:Transcript_70363/g.103091  ORF Transcript_70363/g.103091 Transcript_70363/m.103091 type:complete len:191 (-) Transcript_70363:339-911(-)
MLTQAIVVSTVVWIVLTPILEKFMSQCRTEGDIKGLCTQLALSYRIMWSPAGLTMHTMNAVMMLLELYLNKMPLQEHHWPFPVLLMFAYACFSTVFHYHHGVWYYFFMDASKPGALLGYPGCLAVALYAYHYFGRLQQHYARQPNSAPKQNIQTTLSATTRTSTRTTSRGRQSKKTDTEAVSSKEDNLKG